MDFKKFLEDDWINEELIVEKVTKDTNSILKPYTKKICDTLVAKGINPQSSETSFFKLDDDVIVDMTSTPQIFKIFKRALVGNDLAKVADNDEKTLIDNGQWFIATANENGRCVSALLFSLAEEERKIEIDLNYGVKLSCWDGYSSVLFSKVFKELVTKGDTVSIFVVTTSRAEKERLRNLLKNRRDNNDYRSEQKSLNDPERIQGKRENDLKNYKEIKQIGKYGDKLGYIIANIIDTLENKDPSEIDYNNIRYNIGTIKNTLEIIGRYSKPERWYDRDWTHALEKLKAIKGLNESIPTDVRNIIDSNYDKSDIYGGLHDIGIAAENADYTILDDDANRYNKSPAVNYYNYDSPWRREKKFSSTPARINIVNRLLRKYDALLITNGRYYMIVTNINGELEVKGDTSMFSRKALTIVGISGGSLEDVKAEKNAKVMARRGSTHIEILSLVNDLSDILNDIDFKNELYFKDSNNRNVIYDAIKICDIIDRKCKSIVLRK